MKLQGFRWLRTCFKVAEETGCDGVQHLSKLLTAVIKPEMCTLPARSMQMS